MPHNQQDRQDKQALQRHFHLPGTLESGLWESGPTLKAEIIQIAERIDVEVGKTEQEGARHRQEEEYGDQRQRRRDKPVGGIKAVRSH